VTSAQFSPDGREIFTTSDDGNARIWDLTPSMTNRPDWLLSLAEAVSGERLNKQGILEQTKLNRGETLSQLRRTLSKESDDDEWAIWGRWFLADPATRATSPFSKQAAPEIPDSQGKEAR
jgi:WD40 repeat protein